MMNLGCDCGYDAGGLPIYLRFSPQSRDKSGMGRVEFQGVTAA